MRLVYYDPMTATLTVAILTDLPEQDFPDEIEAFLKMEVTAAAGYTTENSAIYDVTLMISFDGGLTWEKATAENFPEGGLTVIRPYPEGTNKEEYDFTVIHMFTADR